ncbi:unnamed protein product [Linum tenue]|uniref:Uncharacterized protein n=1 Tax=Linum tenue TaxID=586396 RepID=A0AAV0LV41_9ROSI|nr:unnamed protein product [Linum tenue]
MSNPIARSFQGKEEMTESGTAQQPYQSQSAWLAHWMPRNYGLANGAPTPAPLSVSNEVSEEERSGMKFHPLQLTWREKVGKRKMVDPVKGSTTVGLERFRNEPSEGQPSLMLGCSRDLEVALPPTKKRFDSAHVTGPVSRLDASSSRVESKLPGSAPWFATSQMETRSSGQKPPKCGNRLSEKDGFGLSMHSEDYFPRTTSQIVPYESDRQRSMLLSSFHEQESLNRPSSSFWDRMKKMDCNGALLVHDTSISNNEGRCFAAEQVLEMPPQYSDTGYFSFQSAPPVSGMPSSAHDVQAMRVRTTIDSVTDFSAGCSKVLHTTHRFFITKKATDPALPDEGQMFHQPPLSTKFKGKALDESFGLALDYCSHGNQGVKLQPLESSRESKGQEESENVKNSITGSKNGSSSETNIMDMDAFKQNHLFGLASPPSSKDMNGGRKSPISQDPMIASVSQEIRARALETQLPDINEEFHVLPDVPGTADGTKQSSTSITQSLDGDCWPPHADNPTNWKSSALPDPVGQDPCSRWVKRLKPSAPDLVACDLGEASHKKVSRVFSKMLKCGQASSEPNTISKPHCKDIGGNDCRTESVKNTEPSLANGKGKTLDAIHSHPWIRRWCRDPITSVARKPDCVMASESRAAKWGAADDLPRKQFPSIAAMALMGKAMTGFRPCEFRKRGCLILWSNKGY